MPSLDKTKIADALMDPNTFASVLMYIILDEYGIEILEEDPVVIFANLEDDFRVDLPLEIENKINAGIIAMTTDAFYSSAEVFNAITLAFNEGDIGTIPLGEDTPDNYPSISDCFWAMYEVSLLNPEEGDFSIDTETHIKYILSNESVDMGEVEDDDIIEQLQDEPYYLYAVKLKKISLIDQLNKLGADESAIKVILEDS